MRYTILIVDDEPDILKMLEKRMKANGYNVICAAGGREALTKAETEKPDLIILDIMLPDIDGLTVLRKLKEDKLTNPIPVIMLSGRGESDYLFKGEEFGAVDYFIKPFGWEEFTKAIKKFLP